MGEGPDRRPGAPLPLIAPCVVVGGGLAGLAAADRLLAAGLDVTLVEKRRFGGRSASLVEPSTGRTVDNAQHILLGCCDALRRFWPAGEVAWHDRYVFVEPDGRRSMLASWPLPAPAHLAPALAGLRFLTWAERAAVGRGLARARRDAGDDRETFAAWLDDAAQPPRAVSRFWRLVTASALNAEPAEVSAAAALRVFRGAFLASRGGYRMGIPRRPLSAIHASTLERLRARGLRVVEGAAAAVEPGGVTLADGTALEADTVVVAVPAWEAGRLLPPAAAARIGPEAFRPAPLIGVHLWYEGRLDLPPFAALVDAGVEWVFDKTENWGLDGRETYLSCVISAAGPAIARGREAVIEGAAEAVERAFPAARRARRLAAAMTAEARATFVPAPGVEARRPRGDAVADILPGVRLAGDWTATGWPSTMEGAVRSGISATEDLVPRTRGSPRPPR